VEMVLEEQTLAESKKSKQSLKISRLILISKLNLLRKPEYKLSYIARGHKTEVLWQKKEKSMTKNLS
jgi:hypothetical protein